MKFIVLLFSAFMVATLQAQNSVAKIKYEQAEEAYAKGDFFTAVVKLDEAEKLLGSTNPKIMYLRIMSQDKMLDKDTALITPLRKNCQYYLKTYENNSNLEEKYKDVYLVSERLIQYESNPDYLEGVKLLEANDHAAALALFNKAAAAGYGAAMYRIGWMTELGQGTDKNVIEARKWYERSAEKGNAWGQFFLGRAYYFGIGGEENTQQALQWYLQAAAKNHTMAINSVGDVYFLKLNDSQKAYEWYMKGVAKNDPHSLYIIARYHLYGAAPVAKNEAAALELFKKAMNYGSGDAIMMIGFMYQNGYGVKTDHNQAFNWYTLGAQKGNAGSMSLLALLYQMGWGVKKDKKLVQEWTVKAGAAGQTLPPMNYYLQLLGYK